MPVDKKNLQRTPLYDRHKADGAQFVDLSGWQIPNYYSSPAQEYEALRNNAGIIDLCHQGRLKVSGLDGVAVLNELVTINVVDMPDNTERNCYVLNERGGIIDEVSIFKSDKFCSVHCSSLMKDRVHRWIEENGQGRSDFHIADASGSQGSIEVRGPMAESVLKDAILDGELPVTNNTTSIVQIGQARCLAVMKRIGSSLGYRIDTGGLFLQPVWDRIVSIGVNRGARPVGWRALETLRLEAGIPGTGAEIDEHTSPFEIGATLRVEISKGYFMGRKALLHSTAAEFQRRLVHLQFNAADAPVPGDPIELDGIPIGYVTSATVSPRLQCAVGMGFVDALKTMRGTSVDVRVRDNQILKAAISDPVDTQAGL